MADQNISIKIGLDTTQFNNSIKGMTAELKALQKVDLTLLKPEDAKAVISRMGDIKDSIANIKKEITAADPGQFFQSFSTLAGPAVASISGLAVGMEMFGAKTEEVEKVQRKLMAVISLISTLQTIADANKLKGIMKQIPLQAMELKNRIANALLIKTEIVSTNLQTAAVERQSIATKGLAIAQQLWNKAVMMNPIGALIAALAALAAGVYFLVKALKKQEEQTKESEKAMDGMIIKNKEVRDSYNETIKEMKKMALEYEKEAGLITPFEYDRKKAKDDLDNFIAEQKQIMNEKIDELDLSMKKKKVVLSAFDIAGNSIISDEQVEELDKKQKQMYNAILVFNAKVSNEKKKTMYADSYATKLEEDKLSTEIAATQADRTRTVLEQIEFERKQKLFEAERMYKNEEKYQELVIAINEKYAAKRKEQIQKEQEEKLKLTTDNYNKLIQATEDAEMRLKEAQGIDTEAEKLNQKYEEDLKAQEEFHIKNKTSEEDYLKAKEELLKAYYLNIEIITLKNEKENLDKVNEFRKNYLQKTLAEQQAAEIEAVNKQADLAKVSAEDREKAINQINEKYKKARLDYDNNILDKQLKSEADKKIAALDAALLTEDEYQKQRQAILDTYQKLDDERQEKKLASLDLMNQAALGAIQIISDQQAAAHEAELNRINEEYDAKVAKLDEQLEYGLISQEEYNQELARQEALRAEEERKQKVKAAKQEKMMALFAIVINTAMAVMKSFAQLGPVAGLAALPMIIGAGAVEAAVVAAKPIPQFEKGGTMKKSGTALVGEKGVELVELPAGSKVTSNRETMSLLNKTNNYTTKELSEAITNQMNTSVSNSRLRNVVSNTSNSSLITNSINRGVTYEQMMDTIIYSFEQYSEIPVIVSEYEITNKQTQVKNVRVNSEVQ